MKKVDLCARARKILWSGAIAPEDEAFLHDLIARHPNSTAKIGVGINRFEIRKSESFGQNQFWLIREDGTATDFSYRRCVSGKDPSHRATVLAAMRRLIVDQVLDFKSRALTPDARCSLTGAPLHNANVHVDHDPPFIEIARAFFEEVGGVDAIQLAPEANGEIGRLFLDQDMARRWSDFHRARATLFLTTAEANLRKSKIVAKTEIAKVAE
jgi:Protein of unknown function (DUF3223)